MHGQILLRAGCHEADIRQARLDPGEHPERLSRQDSPESLAAAVILRDAPKRVNVAARTLHEEHRCARRALDDLAGPPDEVCRDDEAARTQDHRVARVVQKRGERITLCRVNAEQADLTVERAIGVGPEYRPALSDHLAAIGRDGCFATAVPEARGPEIVVREPYRAR